MPNNLKYPWHLLEKQGDFVVIPDVIPREVNTSVTAYLRRHFGLEAKVSCTAIPTGTFVVLAWPPGKLEKKKGPVKLVTTLNDDTVHKPVVKREPVDPSPDDPDAEIAEYLDD